MTPNEVKLLRLIRIAAAPKLSIEVAHVDGFEKTVNLPFKEYKETVDGLIAKGHISLRGGKRGGSEVFTILTDKETNI